MKEPTSIKSGPIVKSVPLSFFTPSMCRMLLPTPVIRAPIALSIRQRSCTCGSLAAFVISVCPSASTAAMMAFSVAVTDVSSRKMSAPTSLFAVNSKLPFVVIRAPKSCRARKCVSTRRLPMTSPPGGCIVALPVRAISGPAKRMEARILRDICAGMELDDRCAASIFQTCSSIFSTPTPRERSMENMTFVSSMSGMLRRMTGSCESSVAAMQGRAAFLLPLTCMQPLMGKPPSMWYSYIRLLLAKPGF